MTTTVQDTDSSKEINDAPAEQGAGVVRRGFRPDVEGLRAIAVVAVVIYHAWPTRLPGGFIGVDVFFVLSGFLITGLLLDEMRRTGSISFTTFYARRAKRLLPLASLVIITTLIAVWYLDSPLATRDAASDAIWVSLFAMNIHLAINGISYGAAEESSVFQHFWSLAVEEQFYLVWPLLILIASGALLKRAPSTITLNITTITALLASFTYSLHQTTAAQSVAYFATPTRAWELLAGALLAINLPTIAKLFTNPTLRHLTAWTALATVLASTLLITNTTPFPGYAALAPTLATVLIIAAGTTHPTHPETHWLTHPLMQGLGKISYGLYLWHWPFLVLAPKFLGTPKMEAWQTVVTIIGAVWVSTASLGLLEDPVRHSARLRRKPLWAVILGLSLIFTTTGTGALANALIPDPKASGAYVEPVVDGDKVKLAAAIAESRDRDQLPSNLAPAVVDVSKDKPSLKNNDGVSCMVDILDTSLAREPHGSCVFGDPAANRTIALVGDSHAYQWSEAIANTASERGWRMLNFTKAGCPAYEVTMKNSKLRREYTECDQWRATMLSRLEQEKPDMIVTSAFIGSERVDSTFDTRWEQGVRNTISRLTRITGQVFIIEDTPYPQRDIANCLASNLDNATKCSVSARAAYSDPERRAATARAARESGATVIDPRSWFCSVDCPAVVSNMVVYSDISHVSRTYSRFLSPLLAAELSLAEGS